MIASRYIKAKLREEAAVFCSMMACWHFDGWTSADDDAPILTARTSNNARKIAWAAVKFVGDKTPLFSNRGIDWAEAEALLRTGWRP